MKSTIKSSVSKLTLLSFLTTLTLGVCAANVDDHEGQTCAGKKEAIEAQITEAQKTDNVERVQGLEKALLNVKMHCKDNNLEAEYKNNITDKTEKVAERQKDLAEAKLKGDNQKIAEKTAKLNDAEKELAEAKDKLDNFYKAVKSK